jgi:hypothetical protein
MNIIQATTPAPTPTYIAPTTATPTQTPDPNAVSSMARVSFTSSASWASSNRGAMPIPALESRSMAYDGKIYYFGTVSCCI